MDLIMHVALRWYALGLRYRPISIWGRNGLCQGRGARHHSYAFMNYSKFDNLLRNPMLRIKIACGRTWEVQRSGINWSQDKSHFWTLILLSRWTRRQYADSLSTKPIEWVEAEDENLWVGYLPIGEQKFLLFETWHFSIPGKSFNKHFYPNIVDAWLRYGNKG
jgi:hypothetical protein